MSPKTAIELSKIMLIKTQHSARQLLLWETQLGEVRICRLQKDIKIMNHEKSELVKASHGKEWWDAWKAVDRVKDKGFTHKRNSEWSLGYVKFFMATYSIL